MTHPDQKRRLSYRIIGAAIEVHRALGPGLLESVYESALAAEFDSRQIRYERQKQINVNYKGNDVGFLVADFIVEDRAILEIKSVAELAPIHTAQLLTYLKLTNIRAGLLINFNQVVLKQGIKRVLL